MSGNKKHNNDSMTVRKSDNTGAIICTTIFNGAIYIGWSSGIRLALEAKSKLGFIDVTDDIKSNNTSTTTTLDFWKDIQERYQENNGPQAFQIRKSISNIRQGTLTLDKYFSKIKKLWDELAVLKPLACCDCDPRKACCCKMTKLVVQADLSNKLTQFLMGLNDYYDNARQQILLMDPESSINRAYAMLLSIERQREVQSLMTDQSDNLLCS